MRRDSSQPTSLENREIFGWVLQGDFTIFEFQVHRSRTIGGVRKIDPYFFAAAKTSFIWTYCTEWSKGYPVSCLMIAAKTDQYMSFHLNSSSSAFNLSENSQQKEWLEHLSG